MLRHHTNVHVREIESHKWQQRCVKKCKQKQKKNTLENNLYYFDVFNVIIKQKSTVVIWLRSQKKKALLQNIKN